MTIGIDASQANKAERTGTEWYAFSIISEWMKKESFADISVILYTRTHLRGDFPRLPLNWRVRVLRWPPKIFWSQLRLSWELLVHPVDALYIPAHAIPLIHPKKTFTTIHDVGFERAKELYSKKNVVNVKNSFLQKIISGIVRFCTLGSYGANELDYHRFSVRFALRHAYGLFTVSRFSENEIRYFFHTKRKIIIAPNAINHAEFYYPYDKKKIEEIRKEYDITSPYILCVGRIEKKKNSFAAVSAFYSLIKRYPNLPLTLIYAGPDGFGSRDVRTYIRTHSLTQNVRLLGWVPQHHLAPLLAGARCFLFLSAYEGFGVPLIQALALHTPVVANNLPVFKEIAHDTISYCNADNPEEVTQKLSQVFELSRADLNPMLDEGDRLSKKYSWEKSAAIIAQSIVTSLAKKP